MLLDDFTERVDTDISNNAGMLGLPGPPQHASACIATATGWPRCRKPGALDARLRRRRRWTRCPISCCRTRSVLLAGASGGFRIAEALALGRGAGAGAGARAGAAARRCARASGRRRRSPPTRACASPADGADRRGRAAGGAYDLIDISADFLDAAEANASAFAAEAIAAYLRALAPGGIVSIPVSIRDFPAYAVRMLATVRAGAAARRHRRPAGACAGLSLRLERAHPAVATAPLDAAAHRRGEEILRRPLVRHVAAIRASTSPPRAPTSTTTCRRFPSTAGEVTSGEGPHDAIADEAGAGAGRRGRPHPRAAFNLAPITYDRPFFYAVLRLDQLGTHPASGWKSCRRRRSGRWSISPCWRRRW